MHQEKFFLGKNRLGNFFLGKMDQEIFFLLKVIRNFSFLGKVDQEKCFLRKNGSESAKYNNKINLTSIKYLFDHNVMSISKKLSKGKYIEIHGMLKQSQGY